MDAEEQRKMQSAQVRAEKFKSAAENGVAAMRLNAARSRTFRKPPTDAPQAPPAPPISSSASRPVSGVRTLLSQMKRVITGEQHPARIATVVGATHSFEPLLDAIGYSGDRSGLVSPSRESGTHRLPRAIVPDLPPESVVDLNPGTLRPQGSDAEPYSPRGSQRAQVSKQIGRGSLISTSQRRLATSVAVESDQMDDDDAHSLGGGSVRIHKVANDTLDRESGRPWTLRDSGGSSRRFISGRARKEGTDPNPRARDLRPVAEGEGSVGEDDEQDRGVAEEHATRGHRHHFVRAPASDYRGGVPGGLREDGEDIGSESTGRLSLEGANEGLVSRRQPGGRGPSAAFDRSVWPQEEARPPPRAPGHRLGARHRDEGEFEYTAAEGRVSATRYTTTYVPPWAESGAVLVLLCVIRHPGPGGLESL